MIEQHTLETLEFPKIIASITGKCLTAYGPAVIASIKPLFDREAIDSRQTEIAQMKDIINFGSAFPLSRLEDCTEILKRSSLEGVFLDPHDILQVLELVEVSIDMHGYDKEEREKSPAIDDYLRRIRAFPELKKEINRAIDESGNIKDNASSKLKHIRLDLADSRRAIINRLERILAGQRKQAGWQDDVITQRSGRYVIPVIAGQYSHNQGILHDRSQSGATFFVEPNEAVELNNRINQLGQEERLEIDRILRAITAEIALRTEALQENCRLIGILDFLYAAAKFANQIKADRPIIRDESGFQLREARHPLLILQRGGLDGVVPLTISVNDSRQGVLVTGPNTGGKTIALKTIGLIVLMAQSGLPIPADEKSEIGIFQSIFADIGDEQSIELSLSTFSSHVGHIIRATENISPDSLLLFDEIGAGTDPKEGAALAEAIILHVMERGAKLIATTHYSQLKTLPLEHPEIENASLEFDRESLAPTFRLQLGIPGSSYAVEIASRLGMHPQICEKAASLLGVSERSLTDLIASLESELARIREDKTNLADRLVKVKKLEEFYRIQTEKLQKETDAEKKKALAETEELLDRTRKEAEKLVADIRKTQASKQSVRELHRRLRSTGGQAAHLRAMIESERRDAKEPVRFEEGDTVNVLSLNQEGEIEKLIGTEKARIKIGNITTVVKLRNLEKLSVKDRTARTSPGTTYDAEQASSPEIHLRGMTVEEALDALDRFLDNAVVSGLTQVYVVHGKGTGTLRRSLSEYLKQHPEVAEIRLGNWNEGGAGVTVVKLKQ